MTAGEKPTVTIKQEIYWTEFYPGWVKPDGSPADKMSSGVPMNVEATAVGNLGQPGAPDVYVFLWAERESTTIHVRTNPPHFAQLHRSPTRFLHTRTRTDSHASPQHPLPPPSQTRKYTELKLDANRIVSIVGPKGYMHGNKSFNLPPPMNQTLNRPIVSLDVDDSGGAWPQY